MPSEPTPGPSWRPTSAPFVAEEPTSPRWRRESQGVTGGPWPRRLRLLGLAGAFLACTGLLIWASFWLFPPQPAGLVLIGAGYETNLAIPHNVYGRESMKELAAWSGTPPTSFAWRSGLLKVKPSPIELQKNGAWDTALSRVDEKTVVLYFALHGACDAQGPYLIRQDADGHDPEHDFLRVSEVLERLKKLPARTNKVVIFDATQVAAHWPLGILHNDFARGLERLEDDIAKIPNLLVLSASGPDERSWACDDVRRTLYSYYLLEGLKGAADANDDGRVDALELHDYVKEAVARWVRANREAVQTPVLLPSKTGTDLARKIHLTMVPKPYHAIEPAGAKGWAPPSDWTKRWETASQLASANPSPEVYSPQVWQQYRATLLRYEQLLRAGDADNAAVLAAQLPDLERQLEQAKRVPLTSASNTLTMSTLAGSLPLTLDSAALFEKLWAIEPEDVASEWTKLQAKLPADLETRQSLRLKLIEHTLVRTSENPRENLVKATQLLGLLNDPAVPRPAEAHFLLLLGRNLPQKPQLMSMELAGLITLALKVRLQAEQTALGLPSERHPYSAPIRPWLETTLRDADEHRALGQDLLFVRDTVRWAQARQELLTAQKLYDEASKRAAALASAFAARDRLFAELPAFARMAASQRVQDDLKRGQSESEVRQLETLWSEAHTLAQSLTSPATLPLESIGEVSSKADKTLKAFNALKTSNEGRLSDASERNSLRDWYEIEAALEVPSWPAKLRARLLSNQRTIEQDLLRKTDYNAQRIFSPSADALKQQTLDGAQRQGELALAVLGDNAFDEVKGDRLETRKDVAYRVEHFRKNEHWWDSLAIAGDSIGRRWQGLPDTADRLTLQSRQADLKDARPALQRADRLTRQLDGTSNARLTTNPASAYRRLQLHDLLVGQGTRTLDEHWFGEDDGAPRSKPYYREAGHRYAEDAQKLVTGVQAQTSTALLARLDKTDRLILPNHAAQVLTSEREISMQCQLEPTPGTKFRPGYSVFRLETGPLLKTSFVGAEQAWVAEMKPQETSKTIPLRITQDLTSVATTSHKETAHVKVHGFFRGQNIEEETLVELHPLAAKVYYEYPLPVTRAVAVRTTANLQTNFGDGTGALVVVLDCSGSMGSDPSDGKGKSKFDEATQALGEMLAALPRGTTVSVWAFGQAVGLTKTVPNVEETITRLQEPTAWNPEDAEQLPALMKKIQALEPWNESPIVEAMLHAKTDLDKARGPKTLVVLTDGYDNRFGKDKKPAKSVAATLSEAFQGSGIAVHVVGFKFVSKEEEDLARRQFKVLETFTPPGQFFATNEASKLAMQLKPAMRQRLRYWIDREDNEKLPEVPESGLELSSSGNDRWYRFPESLPPGGYKMRVDTNRRLLQNVLVNRGELLLLNLVPSANGVEWRRAFVTRDDYGDKPGESVGDWRMAVLQNQRLQERSLQMLLMLDKAPERAEATLQQLRPRETWLEVDSSAGPSATFDLRWGYQPGYAAPAWSLDAPEWPLVRGTQTAAKPLVRFWWSPLLDAPIDAFIARSPELQTLYHATNISRTVEGEPVTLDGVDVETQRVETQPGVFEDRSCLVVRTTHPHGKPVKVRVEGVAPSGQEHRYYPEAGKYTALFWPVTEAQARSALSRIDLISINRFKSLAEKNGHYILLDKLNEPQSTDVRPATPLDIKYDR